MRFVSIVEDQKDGGEGLRRSYPFGSHQKAQVSRVSGHLLENQHPEATHKKVCCTRATPL